MKIRKFIEDFLGTFIHFGITAAISILQILSSLLISIILFCKNVFFPALTELFADFTLFVHVIMQGVYSMLYSCSLCLSKWFLNMSRYYHNKSEKIISRTWDVY